MRYEPKTEDELALEDLMPDGTYDAEIIICEEELSKKQQGMFKLKLRAWDKEGHEHHVFDYVSPHWLAFKFRHLHAAAGLLDVYETGTTESAQLVGKSVRVIIGTEKQAGFTPKNKVVDYVSGTQETPESRKMQVDDDLPF